MLGSAKVNESVNNYNNLSGIYEVKFKFNDRYEKLAIYYR